MEHFYYGKAIVREVSDYSDKHLENEVRDINHEIETGHLSDANYLINQLKSHVECVREGVETWFLRYEDIHTKDEFIGTYDSTHIPQVGDDVSILGHKGTVVKSEYNAGLADSMTHYTNIVVDVKDESRLVGKMESARKKFIDLAENYISSFEVMIREVQEEREKKEAEPKKWWKFW